MIEELEQAWGDKLLILNKQFDADLDLDAVLFIIGLQEVGQKFKKLSKNQKMDVMHVAVCTLLEGYGYYTYIGHDEEGWPHWDRVKKLPPLKPLEQDRLMKEAVLEYLK